MPIALVVTALFLISNYVEPIVNDFTIQSFVVFLICVVFIGFGLSAFTSGVEQSMSKIGSVVGETLFAKKKIWLIVLMTFILGAVVTVAEPDLRVMASQIGLSEAMLISVVAVGVGIFVVFGVLRILFNKNLSVMFLAFYGIVFMLAALMSNSGKTLFLPISFDSGSVTTGPVTVPFILAFGAGLAASKSGSGRSSGEDAFGLTALASVGPIICVMIMSLFLDPETTIPTYTFNTHALSEFSSWGDFLPRFLSKLLNGTLHQMIMVAMAIVPIIAFFLVYNLFISRIRFKQVLSVLIGLVYAYVGLVLFLTAVDLGFLPVAQGVGYNLGSKENFWWLAILVGALFGLFGVIAEPAVHVLVRQIETVSEGTIKSKTVLFVMAIAVGGGVALAVIRSIYGFSIMYYVVPGYFIALGLTFIVPKIYTNMAFDSGGVASGPMASTFVMPYAVGVAYARAAGQFGEGASKQITSYIFNEAFGCVAMIAMMPLIIIQLMGLYAGIKRKIVYDRVRKTFIEPNDAQVIHFGEGV